MWKLALIPFLLQTLCILFDEGYFHLKRGLPKWECIGHPIDTLSVIACFAYLLFVPFSTKALIGYVGLAAFSSLLVTKDEFVHTKYCPASENWLHALLFTLHPIALGMAGAMWLRIEGAPLPHFLEALLDDPAKLWQCLAFQLVSMGLFFSYQVIYWNYIRPYASESQ